MANRLSEIARHGEVGRNEVKAIPQHLVTLQSAAQCTSIASGIVQKIQTFNELCNDAATRAMQREILLDLRTQQPPDRSESVEDAHEKHIYLDPPAS